MTDPTDYKALFLKAEEERKQEVELRKQEVELRKQAEEREKQAEEGRKCAEEESRRQRERNQPTTLEELIHYSYNLLSRQLRVEHPDKSTKGAITPPTGKFCPLRLRPWTDCASEQRRIYNAVCRYLQPVGADAPRLFTALITLEDLGRQFTSRPMSSEKDLEAYERFAVENHVHDIIQALCTIPEARDEFQLGRGVWFDNHPNGLETEGEESKVESRPDQFCIHRADGTAKTLITTVEYKPPHKLPVETLRAGLHPIDFYDKIVQSETIPTTGPEKVAYDATRLAGSAIVQEFHVMIQEGLQYSYLTTGLGIVQLRVPYDDPGTLYYDLGVPNVDVDAEAGPGPGSGPKTEIEKVLCLCLMSCRSQPRNQAWRSAVRLPIWTTSFSQTRSQIIDTPSPEPTSPEKSTSEYQPSSQSDSSGATGPGRSTRSTAGCAPLDVPFHGDSSDPDTDAGATGQRKRDFSEITSSPTSQQMDTKRREGQPRSDDNRFCTQRCLRGLQLGDALDAGCPNVERHRRRRTGNRHPIRASYLVGTLAQQLGEDPDRGCTPIGERGSYGAPFKITCEGYGYTVMGKGTTSWLWKEVSQEADVYRILRSVQGSAVPVFLGAIDLAKTYFLHGAGAIRHMLLMGWGGEPLGDGPYERRVQREISRSTRDIRRCGIIHQDLRPSNILWNTELDRALIIDFHRCTLRPVHQRVASIKRPSGRTGTEDHRGKRVRTEERGPAAESSLSVSKES